jgi:tetratricopeptide (TPR) repeat protein
MSNTRIMEYGPIFKTKSPTRCEEGVPDSDFDRALEQVFESGGRPPALYNNRGAARHARGDLVAALADFDRALELSPDYPEAYNNRGAVRHALGDLAGAVADFDRALRLNPNYAEAYNNRGAARHELGDLAGAVADFDRALALTPRPAAAPIYHNRGAARRGDFDGAIADFDQALAIDPGYCVAYISRGNARFHKRDPGCQDDYKAAFLVDARRAAAEIIRLIAEGARNDPAGVLSDCAKHLRIDPGDVVALARRGLTRLLQGRKADAGGDFQGVLRRDPGWALHLQLLVDEVNRTRGTTPVA